MTNELLAIGNALLDFQIRVPDHILSELSVAKGSMTLVEADYQLKIFSELHQRFSREHFEVNSGGSAANTVAGFANLGGRAFFVGKLGSDKNALEYEKDLQRIKVGFTNRAHPELPTGTCLALITPDAERTMLTHLGAAIDLSTRDLSMDTIKSSQMIYLEGYLWDSRSAKEACEEAAVAARSNGSQVAMTFSDSFCVNRHKDEFLKMMRTSIDILFCNAGEAMAATGEPTAEKAFLALSTQCPTLAVSNGAHGALLSEGFGKNRIEIPTWDVTVKDKLGAGDLFASGVLYGIARKKNLKEAGYLGCYAATKIIQQMGARLKEDLSAQVDSAFTGPKPAQVASA